MNGVTILNEHVCLTDYRFSISLAFGVGVLILSIIELIDDNYGEFSIGSLLAIVLFVLSAVMFNLSKSTRFEALIDNSVPVVELMENYRIIERRGDVWVLEPIDTDETESDSQNMTIE